MSILGVDIGGTKIAVGTIANGKIVDAIEVKWDAHAPKREIISQITDVIDLLFTQKVKAIGVAIPGVVDHEKGFIKFVTNVPNLSYTPLKKILSRKYKRPVFIHNDAKCFALGQLSENKKEKNIVGLILGTGVGAGVIINRAIYTGCNGFAGELGDIIDSDAKSIEYHLGGHFIAKQYGLDGEKLFKLASKGNVAAVKSFKNYGEELAKLLAIIIHTYDPSRIIIGGSVSKSAKFYVPTATKILRKKYPNLSIPKIEPVKDRHFGIIGAAALISMKK